MSYKHFLLSFSATALLVSPFTLQAVPFGTDDIQIAPAPGDDVEFSGATVSAKVLSRTKKGIRIRIVAKNPHTQAIAFSLKANLMLKPETSRMSRMVQMPQEIASIEVEMKLKPGQRLYKVILIPSADAIELKMSNLFASILPLRAATHGFGQPTEGGVVSLVRGDLELDTAELFANEKNDSAEIRSNGIANNAGNEFSAILDDLNSYTSDDFDTDLGDDMDNTPLAMADVNLTDLDSRFAEAPLEMKK